MRILIVEDDEALSNILTKLLSAEGYFVDSTRTAFHGIELAMTHAYDCIVLDVKLPDGNGIQMVSDLRSSRVHVPILMLTVYNDTEDRVTGLNAGADDYLGKPFEPAELVARVHALVRRGAYEQLDKDVIRLGQATLNRKSRSLQVGTDTLVLSSKEYALLEYLFRHPGQILTRDQLIAHVWGPDSNVAPNALDTYIYFLRKKCNKMGLKNAIQTVRGQGYVLKLRPVKAK